jgi:hypothetical protein
VAPALGRDILLALFPADVILFFIPEIKAESQDRWGKCHENGTERGDGGKTDGRPETGKRIGMHLKISGSQRVRVEITGREEERRG